MNNVWKIGSRWGNAEASVLDLFIAYNCVFFSTDDTTRIGDYLSVKKGDVFIISDGKTPVAIAQALDTFRRYEESGIKFKLQDKEEYIYDKVMTCRLERAKKGLIEYVLLDLGFQPVILLIINAFMIVDRAVHFLPAGIRIRDLPLIEIQRILMIPARAVLAFYMLLHTLSKRICSKYLIKLIGI